MLTGRAWHPREMNDLWARVVPASARLAYVLTGDAERAESIACRTFVRLRARFQDLRDPYAIEMSMRRTAVRLATRPRGTDAHGGPDERLWRAFLGIRRRRRAALALRFLERLDVDAIADVLGCSPSGARALIERGLGDLGPAASPGAEVRDELATMLVERAEGLRVPVEFRPRVARRARLFRAATLVATATLTVGVGAGAVTGARALAAYDGADEDRARLELANEEFDVNPRPVTVRSDLSPIGAPEWCPPAGEFGAPTDMDLLDVEGAATRFGIALALGYDSARTQSLRSPAGPPVGTWPRPTEATLRLVQSGSASADPALIRACGPSAAEHTWKVVLRDARAADGDDVLAVYLVKWNDMWKVWATLRGPSRD